MPRAALSIAISLAVLAVPGARAASPHLDPSLMLHGCSSCHAGHGVSGSPMLRAPEMEVCLRCHGSQAGVQQLVAAGELSASARPPLLDSALAQPYVHPIDAQAVSRYQVGKVTCTSCHAPHRGLPPAAVQSAGTRKISPLRRDRFEFELCESCHGGAGAATLSLSDISRLLSPENRSFHPVEAPASERSPSVPAGLQGQYVNCTDCHGNADPGGPRGPHGSSVPFLLRSQYVTTDGNPETADAYALCYGCHNRQQVLAKASPFKEHKKHVVEEGTSCATCHNPHGSVGNRALIRFGEETSIAGVSPSASGRLEFISNGPGSGACYLRCHGKNHDPEAYGAMAQMGRVQLQHRLDPTRLAGPRKLESKPHQRNTSSGAAGGRRVVIHPD